MKRRPGKNTTRAVFQKLKKKQKARIIYFFLLTFFFFLAAIYDHPLINFKIKKRSPESARGLYNHKKWARYDNCSR